MYRIKNSKTGRKFIIAATAFVALAVPATANAAVNLSIVQGPEMSAPSAADHDYYITHGVPTEQRQTVVTFAAPNGWNLTDGKQYGPVTTCTSSNERDASGSRWPQDILNHGGFAQTKVDFVKTEKGDGTGMTYSNQVAAIWTMETPTSQNWGENLASATVSCEMHKIGDVTKVTHPLVWKSFTKHRSGTNTTSRSHSSSCYINNTYSLGLHLDCWGGAYAQAKYHFALPRDARHISRNISTRSACCSGHGGAVSKYWSGNTAIVRATGWTGVYVRGVTVSYQHRVRTTKRTVIHNVLLHGTGIGQF